MRRPHLPRAVTANLVLRPLRRECEPLVDPLREQVGVQLKLLAHFVDRGEIDDVQADHDVDRFAVRLVWWLQDLIGRYAGNGLRGVR